MKKQAKLKLLIGLIMAITVLLLILLAVAFKMNVVLPFLIFVIYALILIYTIYIIDVWHKNESSYVSERLDKSVNEAMELANVGVLVYNENYEIVFMSELFIERNLDRRHVRCSHGYLNFKLYLNQIVT